MTIRKVARTWAWVIASAWLGLSSVSQAQPAPHVKTQAPPSAQPAPTPSASGVVNLNEANSDELERLPGVGPTKARAIVEHRRAHPFHRVEDLTKVKGIGKKTFAKLRPYLTIFGPTTLREEATRRGK
jgi:competence protein ComEA